MGHRTHVTQPAASSSRFYYPFGRPTAILKSCKWSMHPQRTIKTHFWCHQIKNREASAKAAIEDMHLQIAHHQLGLNWHPCLYSLAHEVAQVGKQAEPSKTSLIGTEGALGIGWIIPTLSLEPNTTFQCCPRSTIAKQNTKLSFLKVGATSNVW